MADIPLQLILKVLVMTGNRKKIRIAMVLLSLVLWLAVAGAQQPVERGDALDEVVVTASRPGPELWRVSKGDHELWLLGTVSPIPRKMKWDTELIAGVISESTALLLPPRTKLDVKIGFFAGLMLLPKAMGAANNPDKQRLEQQVSAADYQRWLALKKRFRYPGQKIERKRPFVAASRLHDRALRRVGLSDDDAIYDAIKKLAKRNRLKLVKPELPVVITDAKAMLNEFRAGSLADGPCFAQTLAYLENDLETARKRADAWADGDILALQALPTTDFRAACTDAFLQSDLIIKRGFADLPRKLGDVWVEQAEATLKAHRSSFAILPMRHLLEADGLLARLVARGYELEPPLALRKSVTTKSTDATLQPKP